MRFNQAKNHDFISLTIILSLQKLKSLASTHKKNIFKHFTQFYHYSKNVPECHPSTQNFKGINHKLLKHYYMSINISKYQPSQLSGSHVSYLNVPNQFQKLEKYNSTIAIYQLQDPQKIIRLVLILHPKCQNQKPKNFQHNLRITIPDNKQALDPCESIEVFQIMTNQTKIFASFTLEKVKKSSNI